MYVIMDILKTEYKSALSTNNSNVFLTFTVSILSISFICSGVNSVRWQYRNVWTNKYYFSINWNMAYLPNPWHSTSLLLWIHAGVKLTWARDIISHHYYVNYSNTIGNVSVKINTQADWIRHITMGNLPEIKNLVSCIMYKGCSWSRLFIRHREGGCSCKNVHPHDYPDPP